MKDLDPTPSIDKESATHAHHKTLKHIGQQVFKRGLTLFEIDKVNGTIIPAQFEDVVVVGKGIQHKVVVKKGCFYMQALNLKNAAKKAGKLKV